MGIESNGTALLTMAIGLGMLHALDADHLITIAGMTHHQQAHRRIVRFCGRWAFGHGLTLLVIAIAAFFLGRTLPASLAHWAEILVACLLLAIGVSIITRLVRSRPAAAITRRTAGLVNHETKPRTAVLIGMLHGSAGSASILALLPISQNESLAWSLLYLLMFAVGTFFAMVIFGRLLGKVFSRVRHNALHYAQGLVATSAIGLSCTMLWELCA